MIIVSKQMKIINKKMRVKKSPTKLEGSKITMIIREDLPIVPILIK